MSEPLVSVVVPTFNSERFVAATIESVLRQTLDDYELVLADHGSSDGTWQVVERYAGHPRVRLLRTEPGGGAVRNWNRVTSAAEGRFVKLLCADDLLAPRCLERQTQALLDHPRAALVACRRAVVDASGQQVLKARGLGGMAGETPADEVIRRIVRSGTNLLGEPACVLTHRDLLERVGGWSAGHSYLIDLHTYVRLLAHGDLVALPSVDAAFRLSSTQWSRRLRQQQYHETSRLLASVAAQHPSVSTTDLRLGLLAARGQQWARTLLYAALARRLDPA